MVRQTGRVTSVASALVCEGDNDLTTWEWEPTGAENNGWYLKIYTGNYINATDGSTSVFPDQDGLFPSYEYRTYAVGQEMYTGDQFSCGITTLVNSLLLKQRCLLCGSLPIHGSVRALVCHGQEDES